MINDLKRLIKDEIHNGFLPDGEPTYPQYANDDEIEDYGAARERNRITKLLIEFVDKHQEATTKPLVIELRRTCFACPSQWEGATEDGEHVYIRYRWGFLSAQVGNEDVYSASHGDGLDGNMSDEDMQQALSNVLRFADGL